MTKRTVTAKRATKRRVRPRPLKQVRPRTPSTETVSVEGREIVLADLDHEWFPEPELSKEDILNYYLEVSPYLLPQLKNRPVLTYRYREGLNGHRQKRKRAPREIPEWIETADVPTEVGKGTVNYMMLGDLPALIWSVGNGDIEYHAWLSRSDKLDCPDLVLFDLDSHGIPFDEVRKTALLVKDELDNAALDSFVKTSGLTGLHVVVPIKRTAHFREVRQFAKFIADKVEETAERVSTRPWDMDEQEGRVSIDWRQNARGKTMVPAYGVRASDTATVSAPLTWQEVEEDIDPRQFDVRTIVRRLDYMGDLWEHIYKVRADLGEVWSSLKPAAYM